MNNLLIELKRQKLKQEFMELQEQDIDSPPSRITTAKKPSGAIRRVEHVFSPQHLEEGEDSLQGKKEDIELQDTEDPEIKQGIKSNGGAKCI